MRLVGFAVLVLAIVSRAASENRLMNINKGFAKVDGAATDDVEQDSSSNQHQAAAGRREYDGFKRIEKFDEGIRYKNRYEADDLRSRIQHGGKWKTMLPQVAVGAESRAEGLGSDGPCQVYVGKLHERGHYYPQRVARIRRLENGIMNHSEKYIPKIRSYLNPQKFRKGSEGNRRYKDKDFKPRITSIYNPRGNEFRRQGKDKPRRKVGELDIFPKRVESPHIRDHAKSNVLLTRRGEFGTGGTQKTAGLEHHNLDIQGRSPVRMRGTNASLHNGAGPVMGNERDRAKGKFTKLHAFRPRQLGERPPLPKRRVYNPSGSFLTEVGNNRPKLELSTFHQRWAGSRKPKLSKSETFNPKEERADTPQPIRKANERGLVTEVSNTRFIPCINTNHHKWAGNPERKIRKGHIDPKQVSSAFPLHSKKIPNVDGNLPAAAGDIYPMADSNAQNKQTFSKPKREFRQSDIFYPKKVKEGFHLPSRRIYNPGGFAVVADNTRSNPRRTQGHYQQRIKPKPKRKLSKLDIFHPKDETVRLSQPDPRVLHSVRVGEPSEGCTERIGDL